MKKRKLAVWMVNAAMAVSLAGCGLGGEVSGEGSAAETVTGTEAAESEEMEETSGDGTQAGVLNEGRGTYQAGTYEGTSIGRLGKVKVNVTFSEDAIESVEVTEHEETPVLADKALKQIPADIVTYQSLGVDAVSGATFTSRAIVAGVKDAVEQAGGDGDRLAKVPVEYPALPTEDMETDILVIGGGASGLMAAYSAAASGANVILAEKEDIVGGTLNISAGMLLTVDSQLNDSGVDVERVMEFYRKANEDSVHLPEYEFTAALMKETGKTVDMLIEMGMEHKDIDNGNYAGTMFTIGHQLSKNIQDAIAAQGTTVLTGTKAKSFVLDADGAVAGVVAENRTGEFQILAKKVIVAAGGASWSSDLRESQAQLKDVDLHEKTQIGSTGDGIRMLKEIGARTAEDLYVKSSQPDFAEVFRNDWSNTPGTGMTLMIDGEGKRFANEGLAATVLNTKMLNHGSGAYWNLIDGENSVGFDEGYFEKVKAFSKEGNAKVAVYGESLEELAGKIGVDAKVLRETVDAYNEACALGEDREFKKGETYLKAYPDDGGYYAVYRRIGSWGTIGGVIVDGQQHVLNKDGKPIANVFAVGETATAQLFGDYYFGGFSLGLYTTAGRLAAENAAAELGE